MEDNVYAVTGTHHGSIIVAKCEGDARRLFHQVNGGESILRVRKIGDEKSFKLLDDVC